MSRPATHPTPRTPSDSEVPAAEDVTVVLREAVVLLGRFPALAGFDLEVSSAEVVLLSGSNGAGKTTVLRLCAGLLALSGGAGHVLGMDLATDRRAIRHRVGLVGHDSGLYADLTVGENMTFFAKACGVDTANIDAAMDRLAVASRLLELPVRSLSTGQRRRVSFAAMLVRRPELWLLDEPHSGLDESGRDLVDGLISEAASAGATILFASHELDRANDVARRSVVVSAGMSS